MAGTARKLKLLGACSGLVLGAVGAQTFATVVGYAAVTSKERDDRSDWHLAPVVVAARDLGVRAPLTIEDVSQRSIPEQLVSAAIVKPEEAGSIINQRLLMFAAAGEPLRWSMIWLPDDSPSASYEAREACASAAPSTNVDSNAAIRTRIAKRPR